MRAGCQEWTACARTTHTASSGEPGPRQALVSGASGTLALPTLPAQIKRDAVAPSPGLCPVSRASRRPSPRHPRAASHLLLAAPPLPIPTCHTSGMPTASPPAASCCPGPCDPQGCCEARPSPDTSRPCPLTLQSRMGTAGWPEAPPHDLGRGSQPPTKHCEPRGTNLGQALLRAPHAAPTSRSPRGPPPAGLPLGTGGFPLTLCAHAGWPGG